MRHIKPSRRQPSKLDLFGILLGSLVKSCTSDTPESKSTSMARSLSLKPYGKGSRSLLFKLQLGATLWLVSINIAIVRVGWSRERSS